MLITSFKSRNRPGQVPGTSDASVASVNQQGHLGSLTAPATCYALRAGGGLLLLVLLFVLTLFVLGVAVAASPSADSQLRDELHVLPARLDWAAEPSLQRALLTAGCGCFGRSLCRSSARLWALPAVTLRLAEPGSGVQNWRCWDVEVLQAAPGMMADCGSRGHSLCCSSFQSQVAAAVVPHWAEHGSGAQNECCRDVQCGSRGHSLCCSPFQSQVAAAVVPHWAEHGSGAQNECCRDVQCGSRGHSLCRSPFHSQVAAAVVPHWAEPGSGAQSERCRDVRCGSRGHSLCRSPAHSRVAAAVAGQRVAVHSAHG